MTGFAYGKILVPAEVKINSKKIDANVFIHIKGYALARVTHVDIEANELEKIVKKSKFLPIVGIENGFEILVDKNFSIFVISKFLSNLLQPKEKTFAYVGTKEGGIFIGFKKEKIKILEEIAEKNFNFPIKH